MAAMQQLYIDHRHEFRSLEERVERLDARPVISRTIRTPSSQIPLWSDSTSRSPAPLFLNHLSRSAHFRWNILLLGETVLQTQNGLLIVDVNRGSEWKRGNHCRIDVGQIP